MINGPLCYVYVRSLAKCGHRYPLIFIVSHLSSVLPGVSELALVPLVSPSTSRRAIDEDVLTDSFYFIHLLVLLSIDKFGLSFSNIQYT